MKMSSSSTVAGSNGLAAPGPADCGVCGCPDNDQQLLRCSGSQCGGVSVHPGCYGVADVPDVAANWQCRRCEFPHERSARVRCELCPMRGGPLKRTDRGSGWCHVLCALAVPEAGFADWSKLEPILLAGVPAERFTRPCCLCSGEFNNTNSISNINANNNNGVISDPGGATLRCQRCRLGLHATCAQARGLLRQASSSQSADGGSQQQRRLFFIAYCPSHAPPSADSAASVIRPLHKLLLTKSCVDEATTLPKRPTTSTRQNSKNSGVVKSLSLNSSRRRLRPASRQSTAKTSTGGGVVGGAAAEARQRRRLIIASRLRKRSTLPTAVTTKPAPRPARRQPQPLNKHRQLLRDQQSRLTPSTLTKTKALSKSMQVKKIRLKSSKPKRERPLPQLLPASDSEEDENDFNNDVDDDNMSAAAASSSAAASSPTAEDDEDAEEEEEAVDPVSLGPAAAVESRPAEPSGSCAYAGPSSLPAGFSLADLNNPADTAGVGLSLDSLLDWQWSQTGDFVMQMLAGSELGPLLSCLHQLQRDNRDLEAAALQLQCRRDRLLALNAKLVHHRFEPAAEGEPGTATEQPPVSQQQQQQAFKQPPTPLPIMPIANRQQLVNQQPIASIPQQQQQQHHLANQNLVGHRMIQEHHQQQQMPHAQPHQFAGQFLAPGQQIPHQQHPQYQQLHQQHQQSQRQFISGQSLASQLTNQQLANQLALLAGSAQLQLLTGAQQQQPPQPQPQYHQYQAQYEHRFRQHANSMPAVPPIHLGGNTAQQQQQQQQQQRLPRRE